jgi:hypothetical protein
MSRLPHAFGRAPAKFFIDVSVTVELRARMALFFQE